MSPGRKARLATATAIAVAVACGAVPGASGEPVQKDGVRVKVDGRLVPKRLPRRGTAPVAVSIEGHIAPTRKGSLPKLETMTIAINSHGKLRVNSLPHCRLGKIDPSTTAEALRICRSSLIGTGWFSAKVRIPEQSPFPSKGKVLAFNGKLRGRPAIFAHIYGTRPVPTSYVLPFVISKSRGTYGTVLRASLPEVTGEWGYVTGLSLNLRRRFLSAGCPAPSGFGGATFPLMRAGFEFSGGPKLTSTVLRNCRVR